MRRRTALKALAALPFIGQVGLEVLNGSASLFPADGIDYTIRHIYGASDIGLEPIAMSYLTDSEEWYISDEAERYFREETH